MTLENIQYQINILDERIDKLEARTSGNIKLDHQPVVQHPEVKLFLRPDEVLRRFSDLFYDKVEASPDYMTHGQIKLIFETCLAEVKKYD